MIVSTFGPEGPTRCSGLEVVRYDAESLHQEFGVRFRLLDSCREMHRTPFGTIQQVSLLSMQDRMNSSICTSRSYRRLGVSTSGCDLGHSQCGQASVVSLLRTMTWRFKIVAFALAITLLAMPMSALTSCWWHMSATEKCTPHCPMMSGHEPSTTIQEAPSNGSCCQVSAAKLPPASMPQAPSASGSRLAPTFIALALDIPAVLTKAEPPDPLARALRPSSQSVFCTFLI